MRVTVLLAIASTIAFATAALAEPRHQGTASGVSPLMLPHPSCHLSSDRGCRHRSKLWRVARQSRIAHLHPNAALPSLNNSGSAPAPLARTTASAINEPSTASGTTTGQ